VKIDRLTVSIKGKTLLKDFSLSISPKQVHVLMGPNGSGKSSLALTLAGQPDYQVMSGQVLVDGQDWLKLSAEERARQGLILAFQNPVEVPGVKVNQFLRQAYLNRFKGSLNKYPSALEFFGYLEKLSKKLELDVGFLKRGLNENFSGGEKKRLEMLQLLVLAPRFAVLDEIDSGLDADALKLMKKTIAWLQTKHQTGILLITHHLRILKYVQPYKIHIMIDGCLKKSGGVELLKTIEKKGFKSSFEKEDL